MVLRFTFLLIVFCSSNLFGQQNKDQGNADLGETLSKIISDARNCFQNYRGDSIQTNEYKQAFMSNIKLYGSKGIISIKENFCKPHYEYSKINMSRKDAQRASKRINKSLKNILNNTFKFKTDVSNDYNRIIGYTTKGYSFKGEEKPNSASKSHLSFSISVDYGASNFDFQVIFYLNKDD